MKHSFFALLICNLALVVALLYLRHKDNKLDSICTEIILNDNYEILSAGQNLRDMSLMTHSLTRQAGPFCDLLLKGELPTDYLSMCEYMKEFNKHIDSLDFDAMYHSVGHKNLVLHYIENFMTKNKLYNKWHKIPEMRMVIEHISKKEDSINVKITPLFLEPELIEFYINGKYVGNNNPNCMEQNNLIDVEIKILHDKRLGTESYKRKIND